MFTDPFIEPEPSDKPTLEEQLRIDKRSQAQRDADRRRHRERIGNLEQHAGITSPPEEQS